MLRYAIRGDLTKYTELVDKAAKLAVAAACRRWATNLKNAIRREIIAAGLGEKLANAVRSEVFPARGGSLHAKARVFSKAIYKRAGGFVDLFTAYEEGARIKGSPYLALPMDTIGKSPVDARRNAMPSDFPEGTFNIHETPRGGVYVLTWKSGPNKDHVAFVLVRVANVARRLKIKPIYDRSTVTFDQLVAAEYEKQMAAAGRRLAA